MPNRNVYFCDSMLFTCLIRGPCFSAHTAVLLLRRQSFQDNVRGPKSRQCDVGQVWERVFLGEQLAGFPPLAQESTLGEQYYPLPVAAVVVFV